VKKEKRDHDDNYYWNFTANEKEAHKVDTVITAVGGGY